MSYITRTSNKITFIFMFVALLFASVLALVIVPQAFAARDYGFLSSKYESSDNPSSIDKNSYVSGLSIQEYGVAYGAYQMSSGNAENFAKWLKKSKNTNYVSWGKSLVSAGNKDKKDDSQKGYFCGTNFDKKWREIAKNNPSSFFTAQYLYCLEAYYEPALAYWKKAEPDFDINDYGTALRATLFSTAIQHGPYGSAYYIFAKVSYVKGMAEKDLIKRIYEERARVTSVAPEKGATKIKSNSISRKYGINGKYLAHFYSCSSDAQISIYNRLWNNEKADALNYCPHSKTTKLVIKYTKKNDKYVKKSTNATKCLICGGIATASSVKNVKVAYTYKGSKMLDQSGTKATVHSKGYYKVDASSLIVRKSAKKSSKAKGLLYKGKIFKVKNVVMGSDGYYWAQFSGKQVKGYVRMNYLVPVGTSSVHYFVSGKCKYCGITKKKAGYVNAGKYKAAQNLTIYKAAYTESASVTTVAKGKKIKIVKVVKNAYKDYWGKLDKGGYVDMSLLKK